LAEPGTTRESAALGKLHARLAALCGDARPRAVSAALVQGDAIVDRWAAGRTDDAAGSARVDTGSRFLAASLTKVVTAAAFMRLVEDGEIALATPVSRVLPQFAGDGRESIEVRHLLTHSSGLPDMVAENLSLRERQAGLPEFFECVCRAPLLFAPGETVSYQSMGTLVLATLAERIAGEPFRRFVAREIFEPAGMSSSELGVSTFSVDAPYVQVELPEGQQSVGWHWNSRYWRTLGVPWGGLVTTASDLAAFLCLFLNEGRAPDGRRVLSRAAVAAMCRDWTSDRAAGLPALGLGWLIRGDPGRSRAARSGGRPGGDPTLVSTAADYVFDRAFFGDLMSSDAVGHTGATGCVMWADPRLRIAGVVLTSSPAVLTSGEIPLLANLVAAQR
jgi:CubicO group peptidase (beta-lactamase class C family)